jgi:hypothetical protein
MLAVRILTYILRVFLFVQCLHVNGRFFSYQGAAKSLARPSSISIVSSVQGTSGSPMGPDPENRVGERDIGSPGRPVSSGLQVLGEPFPSWSG